MESKKSVTGNRINLVLTIILIAAVFISGLVGYWLGRRSVSNRIHISLTFNDEKLNRDQLAEYTQRVKEVVNRRLMIAGINNYSINQFDSNHFQMELPASVTIPQIEMVKRIVTVCGKLEFKLEADEKMLKAYRNKFPKTPNAKEYIWYEAPVGSDGGRVRILVHNDPFLNGEHISNAFISALASDEYAVYFQMDEKGTGILADITEKYNNETGTGRKMGIILDDKLISASTMLVPVLNGTGVVNTHLNKQQAEDMAIILRSGCLPIQLRIVTESF